MSKESCVPPSQSAVVAPHRHWQALLGAVCVHA
jgi:hypothetical protein